MALNSMQKAILDSYLDSLFDTCKEDLKPNDSIKVLQAILCPTLDETVQKELSALEMLDFVNEIRQIFNHACPQNGMYDEPQGLLNLTVKNAEGTTAPVTKKDVVNYIKHKIYLALNKYQFRCELTPWEHLSGCDTERGQEKARFAIFYTDNQSKVSLWITTSGLLSKVDPHTIYPDPTTISIRIEGEELNALVISRLASEKPTYEKRVRRGNGREIRSMPTSLKSELISFDPYEPAALEFINIVNRIVFNNQLPHYLLNFLRDAVGKKLLDYEEGIRYEENSGTLVQRGKVIQTTLALAFSHTFFISSTEQTTSSNPKTGLPSTDEGPIIKLITEYDESSAISFK